MSKRIKKTAKKAKAKSKRAARARPAKAATSGRARRRRQAPRVQIQARGIGDDLELMQVRRRKASERAGQSGDLQGLSDVEEATGESVDELLEEGNAYEAEIVSGVENARVPEKGPVRTREVPQDDVPEEYIEQDPFDRS